jgi:hypothetical protein
MNKIISTVGLILLCVGPMVAQSPKAKAAEKQPVVLPVTHAMREFGLQYLRVLEAYEAKCWNEKAAEEACEAATKLLDEDPGLGAIEDQMELWVKEHPSEGDSSYRDLLTIARHAESHFMGLIYLYKLHGVTYELMTEASSAAHSCQLSGHEIAIKGIFNDDLWQCQVKLSAALKHFIERYPH